MTMAKDYAGWLSLAASPSFAVMAVMSALDGGGLCLSAPGSSPLSGMTGMYLLMSVFHLPPWLRLIARLAGSPRNSRLTENNP
ncbi:MAG TPA: hypothetical protein VNQ78_04055 [Paracoccus sp. (in: a-proteobacteria)]|uniref:hypothetical protein n=1 Tax=Paracoccus sp. TaxID=267 RepID=UPI002BD051DC|nr:hypothetical protein [Paracoccus sp. (in: a-proteobacteria)]HWL55833.1 hypothetical protein [Paracoccus sp. (in: a-proteobacteria)]